MYLMNNGDVIMCSSVLTTNKHMCMFTEVVENSSLGDHMTLTKVC